MQALINYNTHLSNSLICFLLLQQVDFLLFARICGRKCYFLHLWGLRVGLFWSLIEEGLVGSVLSLGMLVFFILQLCSGW